MFDILRKQISEKISLTEEQYERIDKVCIKKRILKRQFLSQKGDLWHNMIFVCKGSLRTYQSDEKGVEHILGFSVENDWAGDLDNLLTGRPSAFSIEVLEDSEVILINATNFNRLSREIPVFHTLVRDRLDKEIMDSQALALASATPEGKYKSFTDRYPVLSQQLPQHLVAAYLGIAPEMVSKAKRALEQAFNRPVNEEEKES